MNVLITGSRGFIGKNLVASLDNIRKGSDKARRAFEDLNILEYDIDTEPSLLDKYCAEADFVFNLAGVNRPEDPRDFMTGNFGFASLLLEALKRQGNRCPVMMASSVQAELNNPYGSSKRACEELAREYSQDTGAPVYIYRFPNVFGKWCRPNYNSAVATFCFNIAHGLPIRLDDPERLLTLVYIDDLVDELLRALSGSPTKSGDFCAVPVFHTAKLGDIAELIYSFKAAREERTVPDLSDPFVTKLYSTYLSYVPENELSVPLTMHRDGRGSFTEIFRTPERGQVSINITEPGITKGNHWHHTKSEKFIVVSGRGLIRCRKVGSDRVIEYPVSSERLVSVDIPPGYVHSITNTGSNELVTLMWASECFDESRPDTYYEEV